MRGELVGSFFRGRPATSGRILNDVSAPFEEGRSPIPAAIPAEAERVVLATGRYIGERFNAHFPPDS